jgi:hypothetical protein
MCRSPNKTCATFAKVLHGKTNSQKTNACPSKNVPAVIQKALAEASHVWNQTLNEAILDADIVLNAQYYDWSKLPMDAQTILIHELGHVLGLKHFFLNIDSAMNYYHMFLATLIAA